jgi:hypothetical protein
MNSVLGLFSAIIYHPVFFTIVENLSAFWNSDSKWRHVVEEELEDGIWVGDAASYIFNDGV